MNTGKLITAGALVVATLAGAAAAQVRITEWQYNGIEFVELTNLGSTAVDMTGWSFDDDSNTPDSFSLSAFGTLGAGQSAILSELPAADFRAAFPTMSASVPVIGGNTQNLGRADQINIYDAADVLVDRLTFADNAVPANGPRTDVHSGNPSTLALALQDASGDTGATGWVLSGAGDIYGSTLSTLGGYANPGVFALVPEPASLSAIAGLAMIVRRRR